MTEKLKLAGRRLASHVRNTPELLLPAGVLLYVLLVLLGRAHAWMQPERFCVESHILSKGPGLRADDLWLGLDYNVFELAQRVYRPLSSYFEIIDTRVRAWLWQWFLPH